MAWLRRGFVNGAAAGDALARRQFGAVFDMLIVSVPTVARAGPGRSYAP
jgi:hypothetical protein